MPKIEEERAESERTESQTRLIEYAKVLLSKPQKCPYCGVDRWELAESDESFGVLIDGSDKTLRDKSPETIPAASLVCGGCGTIRFVAMMWVRKEMLTERSDG